MFDKESLLKELDIFIRSGEVGLSKVEKKELLLLEIALAKISLIVLNGIDI